MNDTMALEIVNKLFKAIFGKENTYSMNELLEKYAFDVKLPKQVNDSITNEVTWAASIHSGRFITSENMQQKSDTDGWMQPKKEITNLQELIDTWNAVNLTTTERIYDSIHVVKSDTIYRSENIYRCSDCRECKNAIYCDSCSNSEFILASQRSSGCNYCIRTDDSGDCSNSYNVICSSKIKNSFFIQDCSDLYECMFCSHISSKRYCIANMQFEEEEYFEIKNAIIDWIMNY